MTDSDNYMISEIAKSVGVDATNTYKIVLPDKGCSSCRYSETIMNVDRCSFNKQPVHIFYGVCDLWQNRFVFQHRSLPNCKCMNVFPTKTEGDMVGRDEFFKLTDKEFDIMLEKILKDIERRDGEINKPNVYDVYEQIDKLFKDLEYWTQEEEDDEQSSDSENDIPRS